MSIRSLSFFVAVSTATVMSCSTPEKSTSKKVSSKSQQRDAKAQRQITSKMNVPKSTTDDVLSWVMRMSSVDTVYTVKDRRYVQSLPSAPLAGSLNEAALLIGILRDIVTPPGGVAAFKDVDSPPVDPATTGANGVLPTPTRSGNEAEALERRVREKGVDLIGALANNSLLKTAAVYTWAWNASLLNGNSELFRKNLGAVLKAEATLWQDIAKTAGVFPVAVVETSIVPNSTTPPIPDEGASVTPIDAAGAVPPAAATPDVGLPGSGVPVAPPVDSSEQLGKAQEAASAENYLKAVEEASKVPENSAQYSIAQENIRQWSNRAVTDLRKQAAFEYRSANSIAEPGPKKAALQKAKGYLEDALKKFPAASNLDTVRDNLRMIDGELAQ